MTLNDRGYQARGVAESLVRTVAWEVGLTDDEIRRFTDMIMMSWKQNKERGTFEKGVRRAAQNFLEMRES